MNVSMGVKHNVFASSAERENYYKLRRQWGDSHAVYHNLPFLNLFTCDNLVDWQNACTLSLTDLDRSRLKKTSIDYVLCDKHDAPLVAIDFDGLQEGVNIGTSYYPSRDDSDWRRVVMNLKLRVAHGSLFPYFIVAAEYFRELSSTLRLTIIDGIIGEVLANAAAHERFACFVPEEVGITTDDFNALKYYEQQEYVEIWADGVEVTTRYEHNPIYKVCGELQEKMRIFPSLQFLTFPHVAGSDRQALYKGARISIDSPKYGRTEQTLMLPDFQSPGYGIGLSLAAEIATLIALDRLRRQAGEPCVQH